MIRRRVLISGDVQGVGFREHCRRQAVDNGVAGWVRNLYDGRVEAVFEGQPEKVDHLVAWAHRGPRWALVSSVAVTDEVPERLTTFIIY